ncbi:hypothetical protein BR93DRAFT_900480 [Coniochaeta sp. PMI_546]|nr:hypothetical protein BR93DRAFT_900480 [Coniochaeta sp. PMI_546]
MATSDPTSDLGPVPPPGPRHHQRTKSSVLRSFIGHRRNNSEGTNLPSSFDITSQSALKPALSIDPLCDDMRFPGYQRQNRALEELQHNQQGQSSSRSPKKYRDEGTPTSPTKSGFGTISLKSLAVKEAAKLAKSRENGASSPTKPKKSKSATNLAGLLSRPKSMKNLKKEAEEVARQARDKENRTPPSSVTVESMAPPPIFAQFTSQVLAEQRPSLDAFRNNHGNYTTTSASPSVDDPRLAMKQRPKSFQPPYVGRPEEQRTNSFENPTGRRSKENEKKGNTWGRGGPATGRSGILGAFPGMGSRTKSSTNLSEKSTGSPEQLAIDPKDIDKHLEAMLDRRNIPENQRYKMRNLNDTIKMEFIRQDWAESAAKSDRPGTNDGSDTSMNAADDDGKKKKTSRGRTLTLSRASSKDKDGKDKPPSSPAKKSKGEGTLGRHFRSKSTDSVASADGSRPASSSSGSNIASGFLAKVKLQQGPLDYVAYLRKVQKPELVEVGKLHKLRLLLRNETVAWAEEFIREGGMKEIVDLLHRIMDVEWREEHEDALLHENLLCLKALCTTALALQYLNSIHATLFPALLHMIFDPEKKGPSEFTTRNIITSVLLTYIEAGATPSDRVARARDMLGYLRDPAPKEEERPLDFVLEMRRERPYRVWCKEVVSVTKEVFWIFLHNLNVVSLVPVEEGKEEAASATPGQELTDSTSTITAGDASYMARHFPRPRAPVPAAPYVGGVEWDATNYLASHLDLLNAVVACTPTATARNALREQFRVSGWERCLGGSLRLCKEKFYGAVHEGLRTWVAAAAEDGWDVRDVRFGPPPESKSRSVSPVKGGRKKKEDVPPPRLEMPVLELGSGGAKGGDEGWLS